MIVVERPATADAFTDEDDRGSPSWPPGRAGLPQRQLDTALQTTLDELRKQADRCASPGARIVASGDAERRRVERNLHDGAQQNLVALAVSLRLAKDILADDPESACGCSTSSRWTSSTRSRVPSSRTASTAAAGDSGLRERCGPRAGAARCRSR